MAQIINIAPPPINKREALRYAGCAADAPEMTTLFDSCLSAIAEPKFYSVSFMRLSFEISGNICDFGSFFIDSSLLSKNLESCREALVFAATAGINIDRLIRANSSVSPSRALMFSAIGAERVESICDAFCREFEKSAGVALRPRISPGYGDLPLSCQRDIFPLLDCERKLGLCLNESLLMSPSKSVTAFAGII